MFYQSGENTAKRFLKVLKKKQDDPITKSLVKKKKKRERNQDDELHRIIHQKLLSQPLTRRLKPWPNPKFEGPSIISRAALNAKASERLKYLAKPRKDYYYENYLSPSTSHNSLKNIKPISSRLIELSKPKPLINEEDVIKKQYFESEKKWLAYLKKLKKFAAPRRTPPSPIHPKTIKRSIKSLLPHLEKLAKPAYRPPNNNEKSFEELYTIKSATLNYVATNRINELATPKQLNEETLLNLNYNPRKRFLNAKNYKATERIIELAKPIIRSTPKDYDTKEDPYTVSRKALTARCSPRIKQLAKPIIRN